MDEPVMAVEDTQHNIFSDAVDTLDNYNRAPVADMNSIRAQKQAIDDGINNDDEQTGPPIPKQEGLITLSGLPAAHWKNLFHLNLVKERNKPTEAPKKPPSAPFFLQWRAGTTTAADSKGEGDALKQNPLGAAGGEGTSDKDKLNQDDDEWEAAWSDDDNNDAEDVVDNVDTTDGDKDTNALTVTNNTTKRKLDTTNSSVAHVTPVSRTVIKSNIIKRKKVTHARADLASLLFYCTQNTNAIISTDARLPNNLNTTFQPVTQYIATIGPAAIDVAFSTLCHGMHDLQEGLPLLHLAARWLLEAIRSRQNYEAVNSYLHRFLHLHAATIAGIEVDTKDTTAAQNEPLL